MNVNFDYTSGSSSFTYSLNCPAGNSVSEFRKSPSGATWCVGTSANSVFTITVSENETASSRTASFTPILALSEGGTLECNDHVLNVTQEGYLGCACSSLTLSTSALTWESSSTEQKTVNMTKDSKCQINITNLSNTSHFTSTLSGNNILITPNSVSSSAVQETLIVSYTVNGESCSQTILLTHEEYICGCNSLTFTNVISGFPTSGFSDWTGDDDRLKLAEFSIGNSCDITVDNVILATLANTTDNYLSKYTSEDGELSFITTGNTGEINLPYNEIYEHDQTGYGDRIWRLYVEYTYTDEEGDETSCEKYVEIIQPAPSGGCESFKFEYAAIDTNNYDYVDLGLPSGTLWATMNVGATDINDPGMYFQWGDTQGYTADQVGTDKFFNLNSYKYSINGSPDMTKYNSTDGLTTLELSDDAVRVNMGGDWSLPTSEQIEELFNSGNTTMSLDEYYDDNLHAGKVIRIASKNNENELYIPMWSSYASGGTIVPSTSTGVTTLHSSSLSDNSVMQCKTLNVENNSYQITSKGVVDRYRFFGLPCRGVIKPTQ
jgi:hypothetical protein